MNVRKELHELALEHGDTFVLVRNVVSLLDLRHLSPGRNKAIFGAGTTGLRLVLSLRSMRENKLLALVEDELKKQPAPGRVILQLVVELRREGAQLRQVIPGN